MATAQHTRIAALDILRGIALFGVMAVNVVNEFRVSIFEQFVSSAQPSSAIDRTLQAILNTGISLKAFALFCLLFGVGLAMQHDRLAVHPSRTALLVRRLLFLGAIGAVHLVLIWNGDILLEYAIAGLIALPFLYGSQG
ncbi:MAG: hypothetical protein RL291_1794, partial [Pseudomonadota bacterium]